MTTPVPVRDAGRSAYAPTWVRRPAATVDVRPARRPADHEAYRPVFFRPYRRVVTPVEAWPAE